MQYNVVRIIYSCGSHEPRRLSDIAHEPLLRAGLVGRRPLDLRGAVYGADDETVSRRDIEARADPVIMLFSASYLANWKGPGRPGLAETWIKSSCWDIPSHSRFQKNMARNCQDDQALRHLSSALGTILLRCYHRTTG